MWRSIDSSAFDISQEWIACDGSKNTCRIIHVVPNTENPQHLSDYDVTYEYPDGFRHTKDAWCFQVRFMHEKTP